MSGDWKDIATAPRDGTWVQLWRGPSEFGTRCPLVYARWHVFEDPADGECWVWPDDVYDPFTEDGRDEAERLIRRGDYYEVGELGFTHWAPLPTPPNTPERT